MLCEVCNISMHMNSYESHLQGKKHLAKQELYDKLNKTIFVSGVERLDEKALENIFKKYGEVASVAKMRGKPYAYIKFVDSSSVPNALTASIWVNKRRIYVRNFRDNSVQKDEKVSSRNHSEGESDAGSTSDQPVPSLVQRGLVGVPELKVQIPDPSECPVNQILFDWIAHQIISQIELPDAMYVKLNIVKADIDDLLQRVMPGCSVFVFGSCGSGLAFKNSDVDLFVQAVGKQPEQFVRKEAKELYRSRLLKIKARIPMARVPIVKLQHVSTGWECDVTAHSSLGVSNSQLIRFLTSLDNRVRPLVMLVKYWAKACELSGSNKFTTYSIVMLVVFFLQQVSPPILPSIAMLQQLADPQARTLERGWQCSYCEDRWLVQKHCPSELNTMTLKQLLTEFFRYYDSYDYEQVISPLLGRPVELDIFENESLPPEMKLYEENHKIDSKNIFRRDSSIRAQDPFELCLNITRNVNPKTYQMLRNACKLSLEICENTPDELVLVKLFSLETGSIMPPPKSSFKIHIEYKKSSKEDSELLEWYKLTTEAVFLVMREIFMVDVKLKMVENCPKVQKTEAQQDVHTLQHGENSVYVCSGLSETWVLRKKTSKLLNQQYGVSLTPFEKEICLSNLVHKGGGKDKSFNLEISSYDNFKENCTGIDLTINVNINYNMTKGLETFITRNLLRFVGEASDYLRNNGDKTNQLLKDIVDAMKEKTALGFETRAEEEDPDIIAQKKRIVELEKQSLLLGSIVKTSENSCNTSKYKNFPGTPGPSSGRNPFPNSIETTVNSKDGDSQGSAEKSETGCKPMVLNMGVGNKDQIKNNVTSMKHPSSSSVGETSKIKRYHINRRKGSSHYNWRHQRLDFRFPHNRNWHRPLGDNSMHLPLQHPYAQTQFSAYRENRGHNYENDSMSRSLYPYDMSYEDY